MSGKNNTATNIYQRKLNEEVGQPVLLDIKASFVAFGPESYDKRLITYVYTRMITGIIEKGVGILT